uniref:Peptidase M20 domain-containing protein 2 n=1 Tax=Biomphalaria glabrata TaxID=6526 RepID=A0A2C9JX77_BIOGL
MLSVLKRSRLKLRLGLVLFNNYNINIINIQSKWQFSTQSESKKADMTTPKSIACNAIDRANDCLREISLDIWEHPELCFQEHHAHKVLTDFLEQRGFKVERNYKLETAFRATVSNSGTEVDALNIGVLCEYDALPGLGHACGHNLIAIMGLSTSLGIQEALLKSNLQGKLTVIGCPAEEGGGGKIDLINAGAFSDIDLAMMAHPSQHNVPKPVYIAMAQVNVTFKGKASHASSYPWEGINALDAAVLCYQNISCMRQQLKPTWRVHGVITNGGEKPNIIPDKSELLYYIRAPCLAELKDLQRKLTGCFEGAALATGCSVNYEFDSKCYDSLQSNPVLADLYVANGETLGIEYETDVDRLLKPGGSTDMGNVSKVVPSIHPKYSLNTTASLHTTEFRDLVKTEASHKITLLHAKALACAAIDVYQDTRLLGKIKESFQSAD